MEWKNRLTSLLGIEYPFIQAPMLGITTPAMVAAMSNSGGLGSLPVGGLPPERVAALIAEVKALTSRPFAVNLFTYDIPAVDQPEQFEQMQQFLQQLYKANGLAVPAVAFDAVKTYSYREQLPALLAANVSLVSFTFGIPDESSIALLKEKGCLLLGTATSVEEAVALEKAGCDAVVAQGIEAGGHRGSFLPGPLPQVGTVALVPQIADRITLPVIAAGGIADGRSAAAAFCLGASGVQCGSVLLRSPESAATPHHKDKVAAVTDTGTRITRAFSGRWARGIENALMDGIDASGLPLNVYPVQDALTQAVRKVAKELDDPAFIVMYAGQAAQMAKALPAAEIMEALRMAAEKILTRGPQIPQGA
ncbi:nitronate monooxygenase [Chitinophaga sp. G-6-1-13]|uniref:Nitronate monooxygenase n=1 Tax=Chitinophaga fulva TaxID=2728842 RepID=A0A848GRS8_9BACT|nr:nitronate monooxygenase [Chitinophaga fulva]NML39340.1 nitronate monooxygenase [Chitinophaga fulva]